MHLLVDAVHGRQQDLALFPYTTLFRSDDQLSVVYQAIVALEDNSTRALEALIRWNHPGLGPVSALERARRVVLERHDRSGEHTSERQSREQMVCRVQPEKT